MKGILLRRWLTAFLLLCLVSPSWAAISAATVWETRASGASDNNGGGAVAGIAGEVDRSQQNAAQVAIDHATITSSVTTSIITFTGGTYTVLAGDVGNIVQVISGTNTTPNTFFQITAVSAGLNGTWTMDRNVVSAGTQTDLVANMGGSLATLGKLAGAMVASNKAYVTGAFTSTTTNTFAQAVVPAVATPETRLIGYGASRGDGTHATLALQTNTTLTGINATGNGFSVTQIDVDCGSLGTSIGIKCAGGFSSVKNCKASNFTSQGITMSGNADVLVNDCEITGGTSAASAGLTLGSASFVARCYIHDNACPGILTGDASAISSCLITNNTGASSDGIQAAQGNSILNCTIHGNGRDGIRKTSTATIENQWRNNLLTNNGGFGITGSSGAAMPAAPEYDGNAFFSNTSGARNLMDSVTGVFGINPYTNVRDVILTVSPYVGPTTGGTANFALNDVPGGGQACRRAGSPGTFPGLATTVGYLDMGAVQTRSNIRIPRAAPRPMPKAKPVSKPKKKAVH